MRTDILSIILGFVFLLCQCSKKAEELPMYNYCMIDTSKPWFEDNPITAHACGGIIDENGHKYTYTNSYEALTTSYANGIRCFEVDIDFTSDSIPVLMHDKNHFCAITGIDTTNNLSLENFKSAKIFGKFTPMTFEDLIDFMLEYPNTYIDLDTKERSPETWVNALLSICHKRLPDNTKLTVFMKRFIIEFYSEDNWHKINNIYPFKNYFYSEYMNHDTDDEYIQFCIKNHIPIAGHQLAHFTKESIDRYASHNIKIIIYNGIADSYPECTVAKQMGCYGLQSDFVTNEQWQSIQLSSE